MTTVADDRHAESGLEPGLRERKKLQTRHAIHQAALELIDEQGLEATTIDQICSAADVSSRTFFNYFPSKAAAALDLPENVIDEQAAERFRTAHGLLVDALCHTFADSADLHAERVRMKELIARRPELMPALSQWMDTVRGEIMALAEERVDAREAKLAITLVMAALGSVIHDRDTTDDRTTAERMRERIDQLVRVSAAELR
jgi:AcrR family transcriptional regulator